MIPGQLTYRWESRPWGKLEPQHGLLYRLIFTTLQPGSQCAKAIARSLKCTHSQLLLHGNKAQMWAAFKFHGLERDKLEHIKCYFWRKKITDLICVSGETTSVLSRQTETHHRSGTEVKNALSFFKRKYNLPANNAITEHNKYDPRWRAEVHVPTSTLLLTIYQ